MGNGAGAVEANGSSHDHALMARHQRGDDGAFAELVGIFRAPIHNYFVRCGVDEATRDDLLQETFTKIHAGAATYRPERPLKSWVFTIAANTVRSYFRKRAVQNRVFSDADGPDAVAQDPNSYDLAAAHEAANWLGEAVSRLPLLQREVILLACIEGLEHQETAEILDIPVNSVKTNLRRARLTLAKDLARRRLASRREVSQ